MLHYYYYTHVLVSTTAAKHDTKPFNHRSSSSNISSAEINTVSLARLFYNSLVRRVAHSEGDTGSINKNRFPRGGSGESGSTNARSAATTATPRQPRSNQCSCSRICHISRVSETGDSFNASFFEGGVTVCTRVRLPAGGLRLYFCHKFGKQMGLNVL